MHPRTHHRAHDRSRGRAPLTLLAPAALLVAALTACGTGTDGTETSPSASGSAVATAESTGTETSAAGTASPEPTKTATPLEGFVIAIDPGHNGANAANPSEIDAPVPDGRGGTKACNTTGTATDDGYPEHRFTWETAQVLIDALEDAGAEVVLSRDSDDGVGPCVDERGQFADEADALVSLHANGTEDRSARGFHVIAATESDRIDATTAETSEELAGALVAALEDNGFDPNPAYDSPVIRDDLATLNHASVPAVMLEAGEMRSGEDAQMLASEDGQERIARAIVAALTQALGEGVP